MTRLRRYQSGSDMVWLKNRMEGKGPIPCQVALKLAKRCGSIAPVTQCRPVCGTHGFPLNYSWRETRRRDNSVIWVFLKTRRRVSSDILLCGLVAHLNKKTGEVSGFILWSTLHTKRMLSMPLKLEPGWLRWKPRWIKVAVYHRSS